jgi:iron complex outermembrane receptor protein
MPSPLIRCRVIVRRPRSLRGAIAVSPAYAQDRLIAEDAAEIVILGTRTTVDNTLSSDPVTECISQSS